MTPADHLTPPADPTPAANGSQPPDLLAEPTFEECVEEGNRYHDDKKAGKFNGWDVPEGHYVAYYAGKIHDHDTDPIALQKRVAAALGVHPARVHVDYPWMW
jgi:hypothetical protein